MYEMSFSDLKAVIHNPKATGELSKNNHLQSI